VLFHVFCLHSTLSRTILLPTPATYCSGINFISLGFASGGLFLVLYTFSVYLGAFGNGGHFILLGHGLNLGRYAKRHEWATFISLRSYDFPLSILITVTFILLRKYYLSILQRRVAVSTQYTSQ